MASGLLAAGVDLDTLFKARTTAKRADVGFLVAGSDVSNRYETVAGAPRANVGLQAAGVDLAQLFQDISGVQMTIIDQSCTAAVVATTAIAQYQLRTGGGVFGTTINNTVGDLGYTWITPTTSPTSYQAKWTQTGGLAITGPGTQGVYQNLGTLTLTWQRSRAAVGQDNCSFTLQLRHTPSGIESPVRNINLIAQRIS